MVDLFCQILPHHNLILFFICKCAAIEFSNFISISLTPFHSLFFFIAQTPNQPTKYHWMLRCHVSIVIHFNFCQYFFSLSFFVAVVVCNWCWGWYYCYCWQFAYNAITCPLLNFVFSNQNSARSFSSGVWLRIQESRRIVLVVNKMKMNRIKKKKKTSNHKIVNRKKKLLKMTLNKRKLYHCNAIQV